MAFREPLNDREIECLSYATQDRNCRETACVMQLSVETVRSYSKRILRKLGCKTMGAALVKAVGIGLLLP